MIRYLLVMAMIILTPPKGNGGMPLAPKPAVIEARVWDRLAAALSFVESRNIDYYNAWCTYPEDFSLEDLMRQCYDNFFKSWHEEYEYWADNEDAIREELHHNQYEDRLYYENGDVYVELLNEIA